jgi:hypothetical protein
MVNKGGVGVDGSKPAGKSGKRERDDQGDEIGAFALRFRNLEFYTSPATLLAKLILGTDYNKLLSCQDPPPKGET